MTTVTPIEVPTVADFPLAASRSTQFAEVTYTVTKVQITNGEVDSVHHPAFDEPAVAVGNTVVRVSVTLQNLATDYNDPEKTASLRLAGDPLEITSEFAKGASRLTGGSGARLDYDFVLPEGTKVDPAILSGAQFLLSHKDRRGAGIPLDGTAPSALVTQPLAVGAIGITTRLAPGEIHVDSITPVLDGLLARGDARYFRAGTDEVFFKMDLTLRCIDANSSGCYFGLLDDSVRVDVDGLVTSMRSIYNLGMLDIDAAHMPNGASAAITTYMRVPVGKVYTLLLGDPKTPTAVNSVPLDIATQVDALVASVAEYQLS